MTQLERAADEAFDRRREQEDEQRKALTAAYAVILAMARARLAHLTALLVAARETGDATGLGWLFEQDSYSRLIDGLEEDITAFARVTADSIEAEQAAHVTMAVADAAELTRIVAGTGSLKATLVPRSALDALVGHSVTEGHPLRALLATLPQEAASAVSEALAYGVATGQPVRVIADDVVERAGLQLTRALTIARTEVLGAYREATRLSYRASEVIRTWTWYAHISERTCAVCLAMHGTAHPLDERLESHPACFPAGTIVSGPRPVAATARHYDGEMIVVRMASGDELTVTPNHPILTGRGWVAAGALHEGCDLVRCDGQQRPVPAVDPHDDERPLLIEDVAEALRSTGRVLTGRVPGAAEDFHGDGRSGEVHVVRADGLLGDGRDAALTEPVAQDALGLGVVTAAPLDARRLAALLFDGRCATAGRTVRGDSVTPVLVGGASGHHARVRLGAPADRDTSVKQACTDGRARHAERSGYGVLGLSGEVATHDLVVGQRGACRCADLRAADALHLLSRAPQPTSLQRGAERDGSYAVPCSADIARLAGEVVLDRVVETSRGRWSGHVYNLETVDGWYTANSTVVHNCRCAMLPNPGTEPNVTPGIVLFDEMTRGERERIVGPGKLAAIDAGTISLSDLVVRTVSPRGRREAPLRTLVGP